MTNAHFFKNFDQKRSFIQNLASKLAGDFDTARFLYLETVHQAMKNRTHLDHDTFEEWLMSTIKKTYSQLVHGKS